MVQLDEHGSPWGRRRRREDEDEDEEEFEDKSQGGANDTTGENGHLVTSPQPDEDDENVGAVVQGSDLLLEKSSWLVLEERYGNIAHRGDYKPSLKESSSAKLMLGSLSIGTTLRDIIGSKEEETLGLCLHIQQE